MRIKIGNSLLLLNLLVIVLIAAVIFIPPGVLHVTLGLPFVLFGPGYALVVALFPRKEGLGSIERVALSFGMSIAVVPLISLILNYTWWGITTESTLYSVTLFIFIMSVIAWVRMRSLVEEDRFSINLRLRMPGWGGSMWNKILSVVLVIAILGMLGVLTYFIVTPNKGEEFTEFYILGADGKAADYPKEMEVGEEGKVIVGIINHEHELVTYDIEVLIDGVKDSTLGPIELEHDEKWEGAASFTPDRAGDNEKVEFLLYKNGEAESSWKPLHLWVDVTE